MEVRERYTETDPVDGTTHITQVDRHAPSITEEREAGAVRATQVIWYIVSIIEIIVALRFILLLFGAVDTGFTAFIYNISHPFVVPFLHIFANPYIAGGIFESASLVAMVVIALIGWIVTGLIDLAGRPTTTPHAV